MKKQTKKRSRNPRTKKHLLRLEKKRSKTKRNMVSIQCTIRKEKLLKNKCLKGKKTMVRLAKQICKIRQTRIKLQNKLKKLHIKNNKCF